MELIITHAGTMFLLAKRGHDDVVMRLTHDPHEARVPIARAKWYVCSGDKPRLTYSWQPYVWEGPMSDRMSTSPIVRIEAIERFAVDIGDDHEHDLVAIAHRSDDWADYDTIVVETGSAGMVHDLLERIESEPLPLIVQ